MTSADFGGIYLERSRAMAVLARADVERDDLEQTGFIPKHEYVLLEEVSVTPTSDPVAVMEQLAAALLKQAVNLRGVGVAAYGPFESLDYTSVVSDGDQGSYGVVDKETSDPPFAGTDLYSVLQDAFEDGGAEDVSIDIQTDAMAGALAEGHFRKLKSNEILVYITLTDGVGGGFVRGQRPWRSAYHSEMGLTPVQLTDLDLTAFAPRRLRYGPSVGDIVKTQELAKRARWLGHNPKSRAELVRISDRKLWGAPASYIAQLCMACVAIVAPHCIVIGGPMSRSRGLVDEVRRQFQNLMTTRPGMRWPAHTDIEHFIQSSLGTSDEGADPSLAGALYLGMLAPSRRNYMVSERYHDPS